MKPSVTVVVGGQFGSEAKGKVVSHIAPDFNISVRTGSPNAGHTVFKDGKEYRVRQIPASFANDKGVLCIGAGALINPEVLREEVKTTGVQNRLFIDPRAAIIKDEHIKQEQALTKRMGSTGEGCGAALVNRIWRKDVSFARDTLDDFQLKDVSTIINKGINDGENVLLEGTQGFGLSLYQGEYPHTTSRDTTAASFLAEAGISPRLVKDIILVIRTFPIRTGTSAAVSGALANEITWDDISKRVGRRTEEYTTVTRKLRRVGEFDPELVKRAIMINRPTQLALQFLNYPFPEDADVNSWNDLSRDAQKYISTLEDDLGVPITLIGTGRMNEAMIDRR